MVLSGRAPTQVDPSYFGTNSVPVVYDPDDTCRGMRFELRVSPGDRRHEQSSIQGR